MIRAKEQAALALEVPPRGASDESGDLPPIQASVQAMAEAATQITQATPAPRAHPVEVPATGRRSPVRIEVRRLSLLMELKLRKNDYKGGWADADPRALLRRLKDEVAELEQAIEQDDPLDVAQECADVANFAMMIADVMGGI